MTLLQRLFSEGVWHGDSSLAQKWNRWVHRNLSDKHCEECLSLDERIFQADKTPQYPHHRFCHCVLESIPYSQVIKNADAISAYSKFDPYLFGPEYAKKHGKSKLFESWGYTIADSKFLQQESEKQALEKYISGDYELGLLNEYGQRINIRIAIPRKDTGEIVSYITAWMVYKNGLIKLITPYGGK